MKLNKYIDHTLLKAEATEEQIRRVCAEAREYDFASVCTNSRFTALVANELKGTDVMACAVVGFPLGAMDTAAKAFEAARCADIGAKEVDMVISVGAAKAGDWAYVEKDIKAVVDAVKGKAAVKVIIETCLLTDDEKRAACLAAKSAGANFVKTSTGFSTGGATEADVRLMRETVGADMGVKASGGVRTREAAERMIAAGATRIGTSNGKDIVNG